MDYKKAGVDIEAGYKSVELMKKHIAKTMRPEVLGGIGGFSGAFSMNAFSPMYHCRLHSPTLRYLCDIISPHSQSRLQACTSRTDRRAG